MRRASAAGLISGAPVVVSAAVVCAGVAVLVTVGERSDSLLIACGCAVAVALLTRMTLRGRTTAGLVMVYGYLVFGAAAALLYHPTAAQFYGGTPYVAYFAAATPASSYLFLFTGVALAVWLGFFLLAPRSASSPTGGAIRDLGLGVTSVAAIPTVALALALLPLALDVYGTGLHTVFYASSYLERTGPATAFKIGRALGPVGLLIAGYFLLGKQPARNRIVAALVALGYAALYLGTATRNFGLVVPMLYLGGLLSGEMSPRQRRLGLAIAAVAALLMVQLPIALRGLPQHGLVASLRYIVHDPGRLFADPLNNVLYGAPLTLYVGHVVPSLPLHNLVTSLSPLPSSLTDWARIEPTLELNIYNPYSALGELLNYGWPYLCAVMAAIGGLYALLERLARRSPAPRLGLLILCAIAALTVVRSTEYNLRTQARLSYYVAALTVAVVVVPAIMRGRRASAGSAVPYSLRT
jgi:hypothetical protein